MISSTGLFANSICKNLFGTGKRNFWQYLIGAFNKYDADRVKEVGADRGAAEWLIRNGGSVRWKGTDTNVKDYNQIGFFAGKFIEAIDCTDSSVDSSGFRHLKGLKHVREVKLIKCWYLGDGALRYISEHLADTLEHLDVISCCVSEEGLLAVKNAKALKTYRIGNIPEIENIRDIIDKLKSELPKCQVELVPVDESHKKKKSVLSLLFR